MLMDMTVKEFIGKVISSDPVPGGGSVSALNGALSASLAAMVANLTAGRKKYEAVDALMRDLSSRLSALVEKLACDVDRDADAYNRVFEAFKLPKETDAEKAARSEAIQAATKYAAEVPMDVARSVFAVLPLIREVAEKGNSNAVTDACVSMLCARTAVIGALLNVRINLSSIKDEKYREEMAAEADKIEKETMAAESGLLEYVKGIM